MLGKVYGIFQASVFNEVQVKRFIVNLSSKFLFHDATCDINDWWYLSGEKCLSFSQQLGKRTLFLITNTKITIIITEKKNFQEFFFSRCCYGVTNLKNYYFISNIGGCNIKILFLFFSLPPVDSHVVSFINRQNQHMVDYQKGKTK